MHRNDPARPEKDTVHPRTTDALGADIKNSPEVLEADRVRREDDDRSGERSGDVAESQREASETLRENARRLEATAAQLDDTSRQAAANRGDAESLHTDVESLRDDTAALTEQARRTGPTE